MGCNMVLLRFQIILLVFAMKTSCFHARSPFHARAHSAQRSAGRYLRLRGGASIDEAAFEGYDALSSFARFSADGHLFQVEYALEAVKRGRTVIAVKGEHCLCIATERRAFAKLQIPSTVRKMYQVDAHILGTIAGMSADARDVIDRARMEALTYRMEYEDCPPVEYIAKFVGDLMLENTVSETVRPYGASVILTGFDKLTYHEYLPSRVPPPYPFPRIFLCDPSGAVQECSAISIGRNSNVVMEFLEKHYDSHLHLIKDKDLQTEERILCEFALAAMMEVVNMNGSRSVELATMTIENGVRILLDDEVDILLQNLSEQLEETSPEEIEKKFKELNIKEQAYHPQTAE
ncbi:20S proteasome subunit alpha type 7 [Guillardia theta CCMP2712]|uniref:20S proteasome subunit alpha type 7 n=2 Tax=Guillardia theta TaxID=55529 RepID=L1I9X2_GUITC|nr:20S proteasome subunit alpha type 7 [Guillardia theta CCMP2712]EKX33028.1 20S proteasome subunit alpha type 7 [Guillardia theta CCMP2712]|mmetsp:Transcript_25592/g.84543  ORF Transcript_25592/g.84543 Transcript_25592/m.84543 type:complete len:348 (+) Transcript_25592:258-1301(+)|eukprot:XP_005820008.1 20S proteasome subunit alpha type 7 [Guillardia theta CCMP2712]